jgi:anti-sigma B factor antagonist
MCALLSRSCSIGTRGACLAEGEEGLTNGERSDDGTTPGLRKAAVLSVDIADGVAIVQLAGELDLYNATVVRGALTDACADSPNRIVVDLSQVEFIDSTALGVLIEARTRLDNRRAFLLAAPGLETKRALEISGLDRHFTVHNSVSEALLAKV